MPHRRTVFVPAPPATGSHALSLHDALPILTSSIVRPESRISLNTSKHFCWNAASPTASTSSISRICASTWIATEKDRKSTRLNSSHPSISYAVFCLKKKKPPPRHDALHRDN